MKHYLKVEASQRGTNSPTPLEKVFKNGSNYKTNPVYTSLSHHRVTQEFLVHTQMGQSCFDVISDTCTALVLWVLSVNIRCMVLSLPLTLHIFLLIIYIQ